ncbi:MAG TPA: SCP2 sterol-binding domain-containing protein [Rubricoccaceae bacterium]|nr:SCP2 sterol-binding domain-containing protein [Rubricoccaceae bacterium]
MPRYASLDEVLASYPARFQPDKAQDVDAVVHMNLSGANARDVLLHVNRGTLRVEEGTPLEDPTLSLVADADDWLAIENGHLNPMMAMMQGKLKLKGSVPFALKFMGLFGYGG